MQRRSAQYYRQDLSLIHHNGFGYHADACAPGILAYLRPILERRGLVVELGCGSGLLTRHLLDAGHRVIATDASPAMLELARENAADAEEVTQLVLPDDPIPSADAIVSVGHVLNYLPDETALTRALGAAARSLRRGGLIAIDLCDLHWGEARRDSPPLGRVEHDWALFIEFSVPAPDRFERKITTFLREPDGSWRRDDEFHENVLIDTALVPQILDEEGVSTRVLTSFGGEELPIGLRAVVGTRA